MIKPIIFLDVDGVLNGAEWFSSPQQKELFAKYRERVTRSGANDAFSDAQYFAETHINPRCVKRLNEILVASEANIVLSSTWRLVEATRNALKLTPIDRYEERLLGITDNKGKERGEEIQRWLDDNQFKGPFVILDDDADMLHLDPYLVRTNWGHGLLKDDLQRVLDVLAKPVNLKL